MRIREGIEGSEPDDVLGVTRGRPGRANQLRRKDGQPQGHHIEFNRPAARSYRPTNAAGATSFHIQHHAISKVTHEMNQGGLRNRPGAARAHSRYVEREVAVALVEPEQDADPAILGLASAKQATSLDAIPDTNTIPPSNIDLENDNEHAWQHHLGFDPVVARALVEELAGPESCPVGTWADGGGKDARPDAGMWLLSRRDLVRQGRGSHGHLLGAQDVSVEPGPELQRLRRPAPHLRSQSEIAGGVATLLSAGEAPDHDRYIGRMDAVAIQPDGTRALITNIDPDDEEPARFWSLVEKHEAVANRDQMSLRVSDQPAFWAAVSGQPDFPAELKRALGTNQPDEAIRFDVPSGKAMRAFLEKQPG